MTGDPEYWKRVYHEIWLKHSQDVKTAEEMIVAKIPKLKGGIKKGLGADSAEHLQFKPDKKHEADLMIHHNYKRICDLEVTGSDRVIPSVASPIWILDGKADQSINSTIPSWFWMPFPKAGKIYIVSPETVKKHRKNTKTVYLKTDPNTGRKMPETYVQIPIADALSVDDFIKELEKLIDN